MIAYLAGTILEQTRRGCVLLTSGGVGYLLDLTVPTRASLARQGEPAAFHVATIVREDAIELYGFADADERETFLLLLSISRLGPKTALAILSQFTPDALRQLALRDDASALARVPGIGAKSAQRIFFELKSRLDLAGKAVAKAAPRGMEPEAAARFRDALAGLANLGYDESEAGAALEKVFAEEPDLDVAEALRAALRRFARSRS